ncbi:MAG: SpoIIE family protein phosphatase [candidate division Zixibacteria bacterium]|nr:SpoIIE family protein phosphatase [candidate division Zixibacteria bacterium]
MTANSNTEQHNLSTDWPQAKAYRKSIRLEFSLYISGIILCLMLISGYVITDRYVKTVTQNIVDREIIQARSYSRPAGKLIISTDGPDALLLNNICKKMAMDNPDMYWVGIAGVDSVYLAHTDIKKVVTSNQFKHIDSEPLSDILQLGEKVQIHNDTIFISVPILENDIVVGRLKAASSARQIAEARQSSVTTVATITLIMILLGVPVSMVILNRKLRPVSVMTNYLRNIDFADIALDIPIKLNNEFGYLAETLRVMGAKLNTAQREIIERERIERELEIAHEIQNRILPKAFPQSPTFACAGAYRSAREVGGDYYDFIEFDAEHLGIIVADVSGKSLPGMLVMLMTRDIVRQLARQTREPAEILTELNRQLLPDIKKGMFVTMFCGLLHRPSGRFRFASAGHNPVIHIPDGQQPKLVKTKGYPLGMMTPDQFDSRIETGNLILGAGDWLIQYTDGVNEAQNMEREEYGMKRFVESLTALHEASPQDLIDGVMRRQADFVGEAPQFDDITLLALKWTTPSVDIRNRQLEEATYEK